MVELRLGDCLKILPELVEGSVDAIITDPPYGIDYQSARREKSQRKAKIANDRQPFIWWLREGHRVLKDGGGLLCFCEWRYQEVWKMAIETAGFTLRSQVIWDRDWHGLGDLKAQFAPQHDVIWFATKGKFAFPNGRPHSVIRQRRIGAEGLVHPNEKPVELMRSLTRAVSLEGEIILDPFMGSGTTGMAAVETGRKFIGVELNEDYFYLAQARINHSVAMLQVLD
jgi:DNA modification methylase